eukprot:TRINITY_DN72229_c0_g1_i1.p1 TRINITY_DN72229_c0_g1~~TRINITY_DN72229_c0_g1_i1.p1  ORF type:complete len:481 (+),score=74.16 TRINITY_DN72229_c0_g1_i1:134-1444(+)
MKPQSLPPPPPPRPPCGPDGEPLSRRQQKKQIQRDERSSKKADKKLKKQVDATAAALSNLSNALASVLRTERPELEKLPAMLRDAFGDAAGPYQKIPFAHGPSPVEGLEALGSVLLRPPKYSAKFLPQEYSLLHKIWDLLGGNTRGAGVLDVGAGNANCAVLASTLLGVTVVCVERESPRIELRAEAQLPEHLQRGVIRVESDIADFGPERLAELAFAHGLDRFVVVAKHPCGVGVDRTIDFIAQLMVTSPAPAKPPPSLVGAVIACCCTNKLCFDDVRVSRVAEFCQLYEQDLPITSRSGSDDGLERAVEIMSRCSSWRSASGSLGNAIAPDQVQWAELFEDHLQSLRLRRLKRLFGASIEVRFAPSECTLQDRCLLAGQASLLQTLDAHSNGETFVKSLSAASIALTTQLGGPIDCRPKGLKSAKYDFDYTGDE